MKRLIVARLVAGGMIAGCALLVSSSANAASWTCSASKLKNYSYSGGSSAMIHLSPYSKGGRYSVKKVSANKVTGTTKDGTKFTCVKK
jgi:hypothetical protein